MFNQTSVEAELEIRRRQQSKGTKYVAPLDWQEWNSTLFPNTFTAPYAERHIQLWNWIEALQKGVKPKAFIGFWGRGGAKSSNAETGVVKIGATKRRMFGLYVSSTQLKADSHVASISAKIESKTFASYYRKMSKRALNQYGSSKGWRRELLRCANGFTLQSFGLDTGMRGIKIEDYRPDFIVLDDVDEANESLTVTLKKEKTITDAILPSGSSDCAVLFIQNLIHPDSIASRLLDGRADFLKNRILSGPFPAIDELTYESRIDPEDGVQKFFITGGTATWKGQPIETCQEQINEWGLSSFLRESQHEVDLSGGLWDNVVFQHKTWDEIKDLLVKVEVWVDPAVTETDNSDCQGISCGATINNTQMVFIYFYEQISSPHKTLKRAIYIALEYGSGTVGVETDNGGDVWYSAYELAVKEVYNELVEKWQKENPNEHIDKMPELVMPKFKSDKAGHGHGSKSERNQRMLTDYEKGLVFHMNGTHITGERALKRQPNPPRDLADAMYYVWYNLIGRKHSRLRVSST